MNDKNLLNEFAYDVGLVIHSSKNYGNNITNFSLFSYLKKKKLKILIIPNNKMYSLFKNNVYKKVMFFDGDLNDLNDICNMFILGSDQTLAKWCVGENYFTCMPWLNSTKYIASYGSSFGSNDIEYDKDYITKFSYYLSKFDHISLREESSTHMVKKVFGLKADFVLDPIFLTDADSYKKLANNDLFENRKYLGAYILDVTPEKLDLINRIKKIWMLNEDRLILNAAKKHDEIVGYQIMTNASIEDYLGMINNSDIFITDSFHGACLAIILNKDFYITSVKNSRGLDRIKSLLQLFNLEKRWLVNGQEITTEKIDFTNVNKILAREVKKSCNYLNNVLTEGLTTTKKCNPLFDYISILEDKIERLDIKTQFLMNLSSVKSNVALDNLINAKTLDDYLKNIDNTMILLGSVCGDASVGWKYFREYSGVDLDFCESLSVCKYGEKTEITHSCVNDSIIETTIGENKIKIVSRGYKNKKNKGVSIFTINKQEYTTTEFGLNILLFSTKTKEIVDSINVPLNVKNNNFVIRGGGNF